MFKTPECRGVALGLAASLAILVLTLLVAKANSTTAPAAAIHQVTIH